MSEIGRFLASRTRARRDTGSLLSFAFDSRLALYPLYRARFAWLSLVYRTALAAWVWHAISERYPIFEWSPLFFQLQLLFVVESAVELVVETTRGEMRRIGPGALRQAAASWVWGSRIAILVAALPLAHFGARMGVALGHSGRYFGLYDAIVGVACLRVLIFTVFSTRLAQIGFDRRLPLFTWNWVTPPLAAAAAFFVLEPVYGPWSIALYLAVDFGLGAILQLVRLRRLRREMPRRLAEVRKLGAFDGASLAKRALGRVPALFCYSALHFTLGALYWQGTLAASEAVALHVLTPFLQLLARAPRFLWKDWLELGALRAGQALLVRLQQYSAVLGALGFALLALDLSIGLGVALALSYSAALALESWVTGRIDTDNVLPTLGACAISALAAIGAIFAQPVAWLGLAGVLALGWALPRKLSVSRPVPPGQSLDSQLLSRFWSPAVRRPALAELDRLGIAYRVNCRQLIFPDGVARREEILDWGRGWILKLSPTVAPPPNLDATALSATPPGVARLDWQSGRWITPPSPQVRRDLGSSEKRRILGSIFRSVDAGRLRGKLRCDALEVRWAREGRAVDLSFR